MTNFRDRSYQMKLQKPDYIFESSWEVCNKVGGIYTVLASRAQTLQTMMPDHIIFIGPDCWGSKKSPYFVEDPSLFADWRTKAASEGLIVKTGRRDVPGNPIAILVEFTAFYKDKDKFTRNYGRSSVLTVCTLMATTTRHRCSHLLLPVW